jgi:hypothetical protein
VQLKSAFREFPWCPVILHFERAPIRLLEGFSGFLLTDAIEAFGKICAEYGLRTVGSWAHVRRKFDEAIKAQGLLEPKIARPR